MKSESEMQNALAKYCSNAERCLTDVRKKLQAENFSFEEEKRIIDKLLREKFIDENRYARTFVHDKFYLNRWGRIKIGYELKYKGIPAEMYQEAIDAIDEIDYVETLTALLKNKKRSIKGRSMQDIYLKLFRYASSKGFETTLITNILKTLLNSIDDD